MLKKYLRPIKKGLDTVFYRASSKILGVHPRNTVFAFNWHNVRHINAFLQKICSELPSNQDLVLADVGGGRSPYFFHFSSTVTRYITVDLLESLPQEDFRGIIAVEGTAENIPLETSSVDIVLCNQVLEHVQDPVKSVAEMYRILKPNGFFIGSVPHISPVHLEPYDFRRFTDLGVLQLLKQQGFCHVLVEGNGGVFSTAALMIAMDLMLSKRSDEAPQNFHANLALALAPLIGTLNVSGLILDKVLGNKNRTPANLCWVARKGD